MAIVFISHSSRDKDKVEKIVSYIEDAGFDSIFLDHDEEKGIKSGEHWEQRLYSEIKRTHAMLLILSPAWIDSKWCFAEYTQAKALGKEIIPIIIDHGVDNEVNQWIDSYLQKSDLTKDGAVLQRVVSRIKEISIKTQGGFPWDKHRAPYPGMMSFEEEDAAIFFGREDETIEVIEKLTAMKNRNAPKFLNIVAASGMGKSSFLKAGVLPQLKRSYSDRWIVLPTIRPTKRPLYAFAKLLASFLKKEEAYKSIYDSLQQEDYQSFLDDITTEIEFTSPTAAVLFSLDQAEELYSLANKEEKEQFIDCLTYLVEEKEHFFTVWTLRSDFLKELQSDKTLKSLHKMMDIYALTPLKKENVTDIIKKPATVAGIDVDDRLIEKIKEDMQTTDALPLLALGLSELYLKHGKDGHLTLEEYKDLAPDEENPLEHIVKQKAEEAINTFKEEKDALTTLKEAFIPRLVGVNSKNEYIKRVALWDELPTQAHAVLEELIKARLLIKKTEDDREVIEIAHEALIRKWPLLQTWLTDEHEFLVGKAQLEIALQEYQQEEAKKDKYKAYLTGLRLQKASNWLGEYPNQLTDEEKAFIKESREFEQKQARKRKNIYTFAFLLVLLFGVLSAWQWMESQNNLKIAEENEKLAIQEKERANENERIALEQKNIAVLSKNKQKKVQEKLEEELKQSNHNIGLALVHKAKNFILKDKNYAKAVLYAYKALTLIDSNLDVVDGKSQAKNLIYEASSQRLMLRPVKRIIERGQHWRVVFSSDGKILASSSRQGKIYLWDAGSGELLRKIDGHSGWVRSIFFSPDGKTLVSSSHDRTIKLWNVSSGELLNTIVGHEDYVTSVKYSSDGRVLASASFDGTVKLWDANSSKLLKIFEVKNDYVSCLDFSPDSKKIVIGTKRGKVSLWDLYSGKILKEFKGHSDFIRAVRFHPSGRLLVSGSSDNTIKLWSVEKGKLRNTYRGHQNSVNTLDFSPDGRVLASGSSDNSIKLWDLINNKLLQTIKEHTNNVESVVFGYNNDMFASCSYDGTIRLWKIDKSKFLISLNTPSSRLNKDVAFDSSGRYIYLSSSDFGLTIWDLTQIPKNIQYYKRGLNGFSVKNNIMAAIVRNRKSIAYTKIDIFDLEDGMLLNSFENNESQIISVALSSNGKTLVSGDHDGSIKLWDVKSGKILKTLNYSSVTSIALDKDGKNIAASSYSSPLKIWNLETEKFLQIHKGHGNFIINCVVFSPDGKTIATASDDKVIKLWDVKSGKVLKIFKGHTRSIKSIVFSPDGKTLASGSADKTIKLWDVKSGKVLQTIIGHNHSIEGVNFSSNGEILVSSSLDKTVKLWDIARLNDLSFINQEVNELEKAYDGKLNGLSFKLNKNKHRSYSNNKVSERSKPEIVDLYEKDLDIPDWLKGSCVEKKAK